MGFNRTVAYRGPRFRRYLLRVRRLADEQASLRGEGGLAGSETETASEERGDTMTPDYLSEQEWQCPQCGKLIKTPGEISMRTMQSLHLSTHDLEKANDNFEKSMEAIKAPRSIFDELTLTKADREFLKACGIGG